MVCRNAVLRGKFIAVNVYIVRKEKSHIKNLNLYLREPEKEEQTKTKTNKMKKIVRSDILKINKTQNWFFKMINKN